MRPYGLVNSECPPACAPTKGQKNSRVSNFNQKPGYVKRAAHRRPFLFCCQQRTHDIFVTGTNLLGMICVNHFVLITGLELQPMVKKRLDAERVFLIGTGSELVVRMLGQIVFI